MNECPRWQAKNMAERDGISLDKEQLDAYIFERDKTPTGKKGEDIPPSCGLPDLWLFHSILNKEQSTIFREKHPNMFADGNLVNF